jgi:glycosyltransferase involved in cell wall biosynthesis
MDLSIIIPLYEEEDNVPLVYVAIVDSLRSTPLSFEIVFVDDGSRDATFARAADIAASDDRVRVIKFRRNYGQTAAISAGIRAARGGIVVTMDGDLQNDPGDIPLLIDKIAEGYHIVVGWRHMRQDQPARVWVSKVANWIIGKVSGVQVKDLGCSLKAYDAELIKSIPLYSEMHRFIPVMTSMTGARLAQIKVRHHPRRFGASKYGFSRILKVMLDIVSIRFLLSFVQHPMLWSAILSSFAAAMGVLLFVLGGLHATLYGAQNNIVFSAIGILFFALAIILFAWGLVGHLIVASASDHQLTRLSNVSSSLVDRFSPPLGSHHAQ